MPHPTVYLPRLIFSEFHTDPGTAKILFKLVPVLKKLGYEHFFNERSERTLENEISCGKNIERNYFELVKDFHDAGLDITNREDQLSFCMARYKSKEMIVSTMHKIIETVGAHRADTEYQKFYESLLTNQIRYSGVDLPIPSVQQVTDQDYFNKRNIKMANAYLKTTKHVFGRIGLLHADGMQKEIIKDMSPELASATFCFFYIHSESPQGITSDLRSYETNVRNGKEALSFGITAIDATKYKEGEIIRIIAKRHALLQDLAEQGPKPLEEKSHLHSGIAKSPVTARGDAHVSLLSNVSRVIQGQESEFKPVMDALNDNQYSRALRRICTSTSPLAYKVANELLKRKEILGLNLNDVAKTDKDQNSALHWTAIKNNKKLFDLLVGHQADETLKNAHGKVPADYLQLSAEAEPVCTP